MNSDSCGHGQRAKDHDQERSHDYFLKALVMGHSVSGLRPRCSVLHEIKGKQQKTPFFNTIKMYTLKRRLETHKFTES